MSSSPASGSSSAILVEKAKLLRSLRTLTLLDGASPYVGVKLEEYPRFLRSGSQGFLLSRTAVAPSGWTFASLGHFQERLRVLPEEQVELSLANGILKLTSTQEAFSSELRILTVRKEVAGIKEHNVGRVSASLDPSVLCGFDPRPFSLVSPPVLEEGKLLLPTKYGVLVWQGPDELKKVKLSPREAFLKIVVGAEPISLRITDGGYWVAEGAEFLVCVSGHQQGSPLFGVYNQVGKELARLPAERLVYSLGATASLVADDAQVEIDPKQGVLSRDNLGYQSRFSLIPGEWQKFSLFGRTAKTIVDAFNQTKEDEVVLSELVTPTHRTLRMQRGAWNVNFKVFQR